jgi:hypothetical protein
VLRKLISLALAAALSPLFLIAAPSDDHKQVGNLLNQLREARNLPLPAAVGGDGL